MKTLKFFALLLFLDLANFSALSQNASDHMFDVLKKFAKKAENNKEDCISMLLLKSADEITFEFGSGPRPSEDMQYIGNIIVYPNSVILRIYNMSDVCYERALTLTSKQYSQFLSELYGLGIEENTDLPYMPTGIGPNSVIIQKGGKIIFSGTEYENIITTNGGLVGPFYNLLEVDMKSVFEDPYSTFLSNTDNLF